MTRPTAARLAAGTLLLAALAAAPAAGQPPADRPAPLPLIYYGALYLGDPALHKELKLTDDQVKKVPDLATKLTDLRTVRPGSKERDEATRAAEKALAAVLSPEQVKRFKQVTLQQMEDGATPFSRALLSRFPEVVDGLKLTPEQQAKVGPGTRLTEVLHDAQRAKWAEMTGEKFAGRLTRRLPAGFGTRLSLHPSLAYLSQPSVQDHLGLTDAEKKQVAELVQKWQRDNPGPSRTPEARAKVEEATRAVGQEIAAVLPPEKLKRFRQVELQLSVRGREADVYQSPWVVEGLKLTDAQQQQLRDATAAGRKELAALFLTGEDSDAIAKKVAAHKAAVRDRLDRVLTADQRGRLKDMLGEPFTGEVSSRLGGPGGFGGPPFRPTPVYLPIAGMVFAPAKALHDELKLTPEQATQLTALGEKTLSQSREINAGFGDPTAEQEKRLADLAAAAEKELAALLTPAQRARYRQLVLRQMDDPSDARSGFGRFAPGMVARVEEVAKELKLTADQKDRIQNRGALRPALTPDQLARWQEMLGEPFTGDLFPTPPGDWYGSPSMPIATLPAAVVYLQQPSVRDELKLTAEQVKGAAAIQEAWAGHFKDAGRTVEERQKRRAEAHAAAANAVAALLDSKAAARLLQIELQQVERQGTRTLVADPRVVAALALTADQKERIGAITADAAKTRGMIVTELLSAGPGRGTVAWPGSQEYLPTLTAFNRLVDEKVGGVLTAVQKARLKELLGEPFNGDLPRPRFGGSGGFPG